MKYSEDLGFLKSILPIPTPTMTADFPLNPILESTVASRFTSQTSATQDTNPVGLLDLEDFRKKQADANGQKGGSNGSGTTTPNDG